MATRRYEDILVTFSGKICVIKLNRPRSLNAFGGKMLPELVLAFREANEHQDTVFTVLTGEGRFFSSGADVKSIGDRPDTASSTIAERKLDFLSRQMLPFELFRSMIDHRKFLVVALNGPAVGGGAVWFPPVADLVLASESAYLQVPFSALGLVPELGSAQTFCFTLGPMLSNEFLTLGRKLTATDLVQCGIVAQTFPQEGFHDSIMQYLHALLEKNDGNSIMEGARLIKAPLRDGRLLAAYNSIDALAERFASGAPLQRFREKKKQLQTKAARKSRL